MRGIAQKTYQQEVATINGNSKTPQNHGKVFKWLVSAVDFINEFMQLRKYTDCKFTRIDILEYKS